MKKVQWVFPFLYGTLFMIILLFMMALFQSNGTLIRSTEADLLEGPWIYNGEIVSERLDVEAGALYRVSTVLNSDFNCIQTLLIRTSLQSVFVYLDDELIYAFDYQEESNYASMWHQVTLSNHLEGSVLTIEYESPFEAMTGVVNPVYYGNQSTLFLHLINTYGFRLVIGLITLLVSFFFIFSSIILKQSRIEGYHYLGLFVFFIGSWVVSESRLLQLFTSNVFLIGSISYLALAAQLVPFSIFVRKFILADEHKIALYFNWVAAFMLPFVLGLFLINGTPLFLSTQLTLVVIVIGILLHVILLLKEYIKTRADRYNKLFKYIVIVGIAVILEIVTYLSDSFDNTSLYATTALFIIIVIVGVNYIRFLMRSFKLQYEKNLYKRLAYVDPLTKGLNRLAFDRDVSAYENSLNVKETLLVVYFDLNDLKKINDTYGHEVGDHAIESTFNLIQSIFGDDGKVYRLGGDEFSALVETCCNDYFENKLKAFIQLENEIAKTLSYPFNVSIGMAIYKHDLDNRLVDTLKEADLKMYENKRKTKEKDRL